MRQRIWFLRGDHVNRGDLGGFPATPPRTLQLSLFDP